MNYIKKNAYSDNYFYFVRDKMLFLVLSIVCIFLNTSCCFSSSKELDYTLLDTSSSKTPKWIFDHSLIKKDDKIYKYFIGENDDYDKVKCEKGALLDAVEKIVNEISQEVIKNNNLKKIKQNDLEKLKDSIRIKINGIERFADYWEQKKYKYKKSLTNNKIYSCYKIVRIKKQSIGRLKNTISNIQYR